MSGVDDSPRVLSSLSFTFVRLALAIQALSSWSLSRVTKVIL